MADVREIAVLLQKRDAVLLECSDLEDAPLRLDSEIGRGVFLRSTTYRKQFITLLNIAPN